MTPEQQAAANHRATAALAETFTRWGLTDPTDRARHVVIDLIGHGIGRAEFVPTLRPTDLATDDQRAAHLAAIRATLSTRRQGDRP